MNMNGFDRKDLLFLFKEKEVLFRHHKKLFGCKECNSLFIDDQTNKHNKTQGDVVLLLPPHLARS